ncbi:MAG: hypothetical protein ISS46_02985 [Candidatus Omnitrophica bacterium]|nr:hypothetical protein [Candidatus Omnitrophota bacterium]
MKFLIKTLILILIIVIVVNVYRFAISVKEKKISSEVIKKKTAERVIGLLDRYKKVTCPQCSGTRKGMASPKICPICRGRGYGIITRSGPDVFICPHPPSGCDGMGRVLRDGKAERCELCGGLGYGTKK